MKKEMFNCFENLIFLLLFISIFSLFTLPVNSFAQDFPRKPLQEGVFTVIVDVDLENNAIEYCLKNESKLVNASVLGLSRNDLINCNITDCIVCKLEKKEKVWFDEINFIKYFFFAKEYLIKKSKNIDVESHNEIQENESYYFVPNEYIYDVKLKVYKFPYLVVFWYAVLVIAFLILMTFLLKN